VTVDADHLVIRKMTLLVRVPVGVVTTTLPVVAPIGTTAVMYVSERTVKLVAVTPLNVTDVVPVSPCPRISAVWPTLPLGRTKVMNEPSPMFRL